MRSRLGSTPAAARPHRAGRRTRRARAGRGRARPRRGATDRPRPPRRTSAGRRSAARRRRPAPIDHVGVLGQRRVARRQQELPAHPQVDHQHAAGVEVDQEVLPAPARYRRGSGRSARRSPPRPRSAAPCGRPSPRTSVTRRPTTVAVQPAPHRLDLGQLRHGRRAAHPPARRGPRGRRPARPASSTAPRPRRAPGRRPARWRRSAWRGPGPPRARGRRAAATSRRAASSCSAVLWS